MNNRIWDQYLTDRDKRVLSESGCWQQAGFGRRPALLVVDVNYNFVGDKPEPILQSIKRWPMSCGEQGWKCVSVIKTLIAAARIKHLPIIYTTGEYRDDIFDYGGWLRKNSRLTENIEQLIEGDKIVEDISPEQQDIVVKKQKASAFFGTPLLSYLIDLKVDSLLITGTTTAGCVLASVIDAASHSFLCAVVEDACFDRADASHAMALCDMHSRYADVIKSDEILRYIDSLPEELFKLPGSR